MVVDLDSIIDGLYDRKFVPTHQDVYENTEKGLRLNSLIEHSSTIYQKAWEDLLPRIASPLDARYQDLAWLHIPYYKSYNAIFRWLGSREGFALLVSAVAPVFTTYRIIENGAFYRTLWDNKDKFDRVTQPLVNEVFTDYTFVSDYSKLDRTIDMYVPEVNYGSATYLDALFTRVQ